MFGLTIGTYDRIEELYKFAMRTKYTIQSVQERVIAQIEDTDEVNEMKQAIENQKMNVNRATAVNINTKNDLGMMRLDPNNPGQYGGSRKTEINPRGAANN